MKDNKIDIEEMDDSIATQLELFEQLPYQEKIKQLSRFDKLKRKHGKEKYEDKESNLIYAIISVAYTHMLETNKGTEECLVHAATMYLKDIDSVLAEKSRNIGSMSRSVTNDHDDHPIQKDMIKRDKFNKRAVINSKNVLQLLNTLSSFRRAYTELLALENDKRNLRTDLDNALIDIEHLKDTMDITELSPKDRALHLSDRGYTQKEIAEILDKNVRTIRRWLNES